MTKRTFNYAAVVRQDREQKAPGKTTAAQVVRENYEHWCGFAEAGATFGLAVNEISGPYLEFGVNPKSVAREFNRIFGCWKNFGKAPPTASPSNRPKSPNPPVPLAANAMPVLNDDRLMGGFQFGAQA